MGLALMGFFFPSPTPPFSFFPSTTWDLNERTAAGEFRKADSPDPGPGPRRLAPAARPAGLRRLSASEVKRAAAPPALAAAAEPEPLCPLVPCPRLPSCPLAASWGKLGARWVGRVCCAGARWGQCCFFIVWSCRISEEGARGVGVITTGEAPVRLPLPPTPQPSTPSALQEKAWIRKDGGEQRAFGRRRCYLIVCVPGGAAVGRAPRSAPRSPTPTPSPLYCGRARRFFLLFPSFRISSPAPLPRFHLSFLPQEQGLSLRVHSGP